MISFILQHPTQRRHCMVDAVAAGDETAIDDLCAAIDKLMK